MTKARSSADYAAGGPQVAGKNAVINGGFDIWQRGTSFTVASTTRTYTADRWMAYRTATGATVTRQNTSPNYSPYYVRVARDSGDAATNILYLTQAIETLNSKPLAGKTVTLTWWARAGANYSSTSNLMTWELAYGTGTDQNMISGFTGQTNITTGTKTLTTSWQQFTTTGTVSTSATQIGFNFYYTPTGTAGAADYFEIADVQLEVGSVATPFSRAGGTIQGELAACQRYYVRFNSTASFPYALFTLGAGTGSSTNCVGWTSLPVEMRTIPQSVEYGGTIRIIPFGGAESNVSSISLQDRTNNKIVSITYNGSGMTSGLYAYVRANNDANAYLGISAEL